MRLRHKSAAKKARKAGKGGAKNGEKERTSIALPPGIWNAGVQRAKDERRTFSNYLECLIERDMKAAAATK